MRCSYNFSTWQMRAPLRLVSVTRMPSNPVDASTSTPKVWNVKLMVPSEPQQAHMACWKALMVLHVRDTVGIQVRGIGAQQVRCRAMSRELWCTTGNKPPTSQDSPSVSRRMSYHGRAASVSPESQIEAALCSAQPPRGAAVPLSWRAARERQR